MAHPWFYNEAKIRFIITSQPSESVSKTSDILYMLFMRKCWIFQPWIFLGFSAMIFIFRRGLVIYFYILKWLFIGVYVRSNSIFFGLTNLCSHISPILLEEF